MPKSKNPYFIDWLKSEAKLVLMEDLENDILSLEEAEVPTAFAWGVYREHPAFKNLVCYEQFKARLENHRKQVKLRRGKMQEELAAFQHDRKLHPRATHNNRGEYVFDMTPAKALLRDDVKNKRHVGKKSTELWMMRPEYQVFCVQDKFGERIRQEIRYQKFVYYLNEKRMEKEEAAAVYRKELEAQREELRKKQQEEIAKQSAKANNKRHRN